MATNKFDKQHQSNLSAYEREIDRLYRKIISQAVPIGVSLPDFKADRLFSFDDYPAISKRLEKLLQAMQSGLSTIILNGIDAEWTLANNKNSELARQVFGDNIGKMTKEQERRYFSTNDSAREAFTKRKVNGLNLSDRVWRYTDQFKSEIELGLDIGIRNGLSAEAMSRELRDYLRHTDKLFRRVRDEHGELQLSKRAAAFHPGQGVYRSSYKNARRLAATETNMAYMTADYERWQQLDFVVGIEIKLSNNHTLNGVPFTDICDELKGRYPKDFKFTGWHPHCRCRAVTILKTDEEIAEDTRRILDGKPLDGKSVNRVDDVPDAFKNWLQSNRQRILNAKSLPYFIKDNGQYIKTTRNPLDIASERHKSRAQAQIREIKLRAWNRQLQMNMPQLTKAERKAIAENWLLLEQRLGIKKGRMMTIEEADRQAANPKFNKGRAYKENCQTCSPAFMLRMWGFNITAKGNFAGSLSEKLSHPSLNYDKWRNIDKTKITLNTTRGFMAQKGYKVMNQARYIEFFNTACAKQGFYELTINWKNGGAHSTLLYRNSKNELYRIEPQVYMTSRGVLCDIKELAAQGSAYPIANIGIARIDNKIFNKDYASIFDK